MHIITNYINEKHKKVRASFTHTCTHYIMQYAMRYWPMFYCAVTWERLGNTGLKYGKKKEVDLWTEKSKPKPK